MPKSKSSCNLSPSPPPAMLERGDGHKPRKEFGQNFLIDQLVIEEIITAINIKKDQTIIEIGPGLGAITTSIIANCAKLIAIEIDRDLFNKLTQKFQHAISNNQLTIINQDVLNIDFFSLLSPNHKARIVGNLPYNISTPLLFKLFGCSSLINDMHFLLQKEVAERLGSAPNSKQYGRLSIMAQYHSKIDTMFHVGAKSFNPVPKVESCMVRFVPHTILPVKANDYEHFYKLVTAAFCQRRKILSNSLKQYCSASSLELLGVNPMARPEQLSVADFVKISNSLTLR